MVKVVVLDHGNGKFKYRSEIKKGVKPSIVAFKKDVGESLIGKELKLKTYEVNGIEYVWGEDVTKVKETYPTYGFQNRYKEPMYKILSEIALTNLALESKIKQTDEVIVITGVPSNEINTQAAEDLKKVFIDEEKGGLHTVKINGKLVKVNVSEVVVIPQPIGTVMNNYLDENGFVKEDRYEQIRVGIIDIGTGTTDLDSINGLSRENEFKSIEAGMKDVYQLIADYINKQNSNAKVEYYQVEPYFKKGIYPISLRHEVDFNEVKEQAVKEIAEKIKKGIKSSWKTFDRFDEIILTGGGAKLFETYINELVDVVAVPEEPQLANADGFYKYGVYKVSED